MNKKVTVVMTVYNREATYIREAIQGILNQTYKDFEFYIVNNGSTDIECEKTILEFDDERIIYVSLTQNGVFAPNTFFYRELMSLGEGKYIIWTHDDDIALEEMLEKEVELLDSDSDIACVASNMYFINRTGEKIDKTYKYSENIIYQRDEFVVATCRNPEGVGFPTPTIMYRREVILDAVNYFIVKNKNGLSLDLQWKLYINHKYKKMVLLKDPLYLYRAHNQQVSSDTSAVDHSCLDEVYIFLKESISDEFANEYYKIVMNRLGRNEIAKRINDKLKDVDGIDEYIESHRYKIVQLSKQFGRSYNAVAGGVKKIYYMKTILGLKEFVLYGAGYESYMINTIIDEIDGIIKCVGYIDTFKSGIHEDGLPIYKRDEYDYSRGIYIIVGATVAEVDIREFLLSEKKLVEMRDFMPQFAYD